MALLLLILDFFGFVGYFYLSIYVLHKNTKSVLHRAFSGFLLCFALWSFCLIFTQYPFAVSKNVVQIAYNLASFGWIGFASFYLFFALAATESILILHNRLFKILLILVPLFFIYLQWKGLILVDYLTQSWGWNYVWGKNIWVYLFYLYFCLCVWFGFYSEYKFIQSTRDLVKQKQLKVVLFFSLVAFFVGIITNIVLHKSGVYSVPPLGPFAMFISISGIGYAMVRYKFLSISPITAAENILSTMSEVLILLDQNGFIVKVNQSGVERTGYSNEVLLNQPLAKIFGQDTSLLERISWGEKLVNYECAIYSKDGSLIPVILSTSLLKDGAGTIAGTVCIARDITERKKSEDDLKNAYQKLKETHTQLAQASKIASIGMLAGGVAHEINNPLAGVLNNAQLIKMLADQKKVTTIEDIRDLLNSIEDSAFRCAKIVRSLLDLSHVSTEKYVPISFNAIVEKVVSLIGKEFELENMNIEVETELDLPLVLGNEQLMQQVVLDLISNARWAIKKTGINHVGRIIIKTSFHSTNQWVGFSISDNGIGIPKDNLALVFDPFFTTKAVGEGTGLGLSLVYNIIKQHGGNITVVSEVSQGTTFTILLPVIT